MKRVQKALKAAAAHIPSKAELAKNQRKAEINARFNFAQNELENKLKYNAIEFKGVNRKAVIDFFDEFKSIMTGGSSDPRRRKAAEAALKGTPAEKAIREIIRSWMSAEKVRGEAGYKFVKKTAQA